MLIEGKNAVLEALQAGITINKLLVDQALKNRRDKIVDLAYQNKVKVEFLPKNILDKKSKTSHHQGFIALSVNFSYCELDVFLNLAYSIHEKPFIVLLDVIEDPHNLGAIIRSCECAGVHGVIITKNRCAQINETVFKTSAGAISNMLVCKVTNLKDAITYLKEKDIFVFATDAKGENIYNKKLDCPIGIIIGSEGFGIKPSLIKYCDGTLALPLKGKVNSLNASVACAITIFEVLRQREGQHD